MKTKQRIFFLMFFILPFLSTANASPTIPSVEAKSITYYSAPKHEKEARATEASCRSFIEGDYSIMSPSDKKAVKDSPYGINCLNAHAGVKRANERVIAAKMHAYQQELRNSAAGSREPAPHTK